ncbi:MAG TPA: class II aldolase/adducin family protein [Planctomycetaceae bacterium]
MPDRRYLPPQDEILDLMERIYRFRMTTTSGGNLSIRDEEGDVWITPARVDKGSLRREDVVRVRPDGTTEGIRRPSSELPFHRAIYAARPDLRGIVHAHPVALVAFSLCRKVPDTRLFHQARHVCGEVGFAPYALPGSEALGRNIAAAFAAGHDCVVLENHGVVTGGATLQEAFERFETLEFVAKTFVKAKLLGEPRVLSDGQIAAAANADRSVPSGPAVEPSVAERELRHQLAEFVRRGYRQRLLTSTQGSFSARLGGDAFLVTPYRGDRHRVEPGDLVAVRDGWAEAGKMPSRATKLHRAIYRRHPEVATVVNAFPVNATAFAVTGGRPDVRAIPESYVVVRGVESIPFGPQFGDAESVAERVDLDRPAAVIENDGVLVLGTGVLDAFDRLEVLEATAEALINSRPLGGAVPMPAAVLAELETAFGLRPRGRRS